MSHNVQFMSTDPGFGVALEICKVPAGLRFTAHGSSVVSVWVDPNDALDIAVSILEAAGQQSVIVPLRDLPEVSQDHTGDPTSFRAGGESVVFTSAENAREWTLRDIAVWKFIEARDKRDAETRQKLQERRVAVLASLLPEAAAANNLPEPHELSMLDGRAIDRIIELEDGQATA